MDEYLESLVKKGRSFVEPEVEGAVEEVVPEEVIEQLSPADEVAAEDAGVTESEPSKEECKDVVVELASCAEKGDEPKEQKKEKAKKGPKLDHADITELEVNKEYDIKNARVFKTPDLRQVSQLISGRVIYLGQVGEFAIVKYMCHGFGLVQGYIRNLEKSLV